MSLTVEQGRERLEELRRQRTDARQGLDALDTERRTLLRTLLDLGVSQAELARWEGVTQWAVAQAVKKAEPSPVLPRRRRSVL